MSSTFTTNGGIEKPGTGEQAGTWGNTANNNFDIIDRLVNGSVSISLTGLTTYTLATSNGTLSLGQYMIITFTGSPSATVTVSITPQTASKIYFFKNSTGQSVIISQGSGATVTIPTGTTKMIYTDGAGTTAAVYDFTTYLSMANIAVTGGSITGITDLAVADGGTGASDAATARTNLGLGTIATQAASAVAITGGSITGITDLAIADGGTGASTATNARTNLGLGTMATQAASAVAITGGTITGGAITGATVDNVVIGGTTAVAGSFTVVTSPSFTYAGGIVVSATGANTVTISTNSTARFVFGSDGTTSLSSGTGVTSTAASDGTKSSGTYTPTPVGGNFKYITNGGAFTLAAPTASGDYSLVIQITNNATAGAITFSGFTKTQGSPLTTTNTSKFLVYVTKVNGLTLANVVALQ